MSTEDGHQTFTTSDGQEIRRPRRKKAILRDRYQDLIDGKINVEDLDEEELFRGRFRGVDGKFRGVPPKVIPHAMHQAFVDHVGQRLEESIITNMPDILDRLIRIATGEAGGDTGIAMDVQAKAAMYLTDRILGKPTEKQQVDVNVTAKWEQAFEGGDLVVDIPESDIIDVEPVDEGSPEHARSSLPALPETGALVERPEQNSGRESDGAVAPSNPQPRPRPKTGVKLK